MPSPRFGMMGEVPLLGFGTKQGSYEVVTSLSIAQGKGDAFLIALNRAVSEWPGTIYVRPFGEMNGHWNSYCAFK